MGWKGSVLIVTALSVFESNLFCILFELLLLYFVCIYIYIYLSLYLCMLLLLLLLTNVALQDNSQQAKNGQSDDARKGH